MDSKYILQLSNYNYLSNYNERILTLNTLTYTPNINEAKKITKLDVSLFLPGISIYHPLDAYLRTINNRYSYPKKRFEIINIIEVN